ncbi:hypothetical protein [Streptomyces sp.]|uniref:hypothetical protein n=1 Tax=Streptomyces sp. TaxID=1931 RepID=UPI002F936349
MSSKPVTVYAAVCDLCGAEVITSYQNPVEAVRGMAGLQWVRRGDELACKRCAEDQRWADCAATFGEHAWYRWPATWASSAADQPHTPWMREKDGQPRWRMRKCGSCGYAEHQDQGEPWVSYRLLEAM